MMIAPSSNYPIISALYLSEGRDHTTTSRQWGVGGQT